MGVADLHAHLMAHLAFGGKAFWGLPFDPKHPGPEGVEYALSSCEPIHGGLVNINPELGHPAGGGWPEFIIWPRFTTISHQQAYVDWLFRAYQGGLRLVSCLAVKTRCWHPRLTPAFLKMVALSGLRSPSTRPAFIRISTAIHPTTLPNPIC
ncbi:MAG: hypothetical protein ACYCZF_03695 [Anaerolineae bacterium]